MNFGMNRPNATVMDALNEIHEERGVVRKLEIRVKDLERELKQATTCHRVRFGGGDSFTDASIPVNEVLDALLAHLGLTVEKEVPVQVAPKVVIKPKESK